MMRRPTAIVAGLLLAAALPLAGCSTDETSADSSPSVSEASPETSDAASADTSEAAETPEGAASESAAAEDETSSAEESVVASYAELTEKYAGQATESLDCAAGAETISNPGAIAEVTASCADVTVDGMGVVVLAKDVENLTVAGTGNIVIIETATAITLSGTGNTVVWDTGEPTVTDSGTGNFTTESIPA